MGSTATVECLEDRVRSYVRQARDRYGDVAMGCVRMEACDHFVGIVYDKPGGSSAQYEASYDPARGYIILAPNGDLILEQDAERVYDRFVQVIEGIPAARRQAIDRQIAEWRERGINGARLKAMVMSFNSHYDGTRGGEMAPEEIRYAARVAA